MSPAAPSDEQRFTELGESLRRAILDALPAWIDRGVSDRVLDRRVAPAQVTAVAAEVVAAVDRRLHELIAADVDEPRSGPLEIVRQELGPVTALLRKLEADEPPRDPFDEAVRPDDVFELGPMAFADLGPEVHERGIAWGAAKAYVHRRRRAGESTPESD